MKRTAAAFVLVAGLGGCVSPDSGKKFAMPDKGREARSSAVQPGVKQAEARQSVAAMPRQGVRGTRSVEPGTINDPAVQQAAGFARIRGVGNAAGGCATGDCGPIGGGYVGRGAGGPFRMPEEAYGPRQGFINTMWGGGGILPAPGMGPQGVVAGQGFIGPGLGMNAMYSNQRTSIRFAAPNGMKIAFQDPNQGFAEAGREAPVRYNFPQGAIYRLRLSGIPSQPGKSFYPTLEVYPSTQKTVTFLSHSTVPIGFSDQDFDQVKAGNLVVKVIYLPDAAFQDLAAAEEIVSTPLEPGVDPIVEANRRGTILAVIRIGNIDLEDPSTPAMDAPPSGYGPGGPSTEMPTPRPLPVTPMPMPMPMPPSESSLPANPSPTRTPNNLPPLQLPGSN
jgi:hypothetical protein